jgi:hypothetical protein
VHRGWQPRCRHNVRPSLQRKTTLKLKNDCYRSRLRPFTPLSMPSSRLDRTSPISCPYFTENIDLRK